MLSSCIVVSFSRKDDDGSTSISKNDSIQIAGFNIENFDDEPRLLKSGLPVSEEIDGGNITALMGRKKYTWIVIWATWYPHSYFDLPRSYRFF
ncbi:MAG: hypothetical protein NT126_01825 [Bacteroidetes bacterium]|nr:hypothetical protein [Bacteroidota bacterium]